MGVLYIFQREVRSYFQSFIAYMVIAIFLVLAGYFFYTDLIMHVMWSFHKADFDRIWEYYFNSDLRYVIMIVIPLLTMRLFAEEKKLGTIELLWTYPIRDWELLAGKYAASLLLLLVMLGLSLTYPLIAYLLYDIDMTAVIAGYLGLLLLGSSCIACGILISSLTENQILAALGSYGLLLMFWFLTWNEAAASESVIKVLLNLSLFDRLVTFTRGAIDVKDLIFFVNFHGFFLLLTMISLSARMWKGVR
ncbi:MAG TPA: ABC transporter permease subunit [Thermodesulfobacteriota bacterium]|nr:ABC transporter permease [Deltaproteobacteria bacterium]HNR12834.1 ABC transporter permease subunit [Thermodesulfobacteriota bacterium]HNU72958.1 ABC transporter permease subunit [Thermodesulfobacteriota bacterium]HQO78026.1 ABC transporter permease subunit [Thermodesulfobacteriota bacterium]